MQKATLKISAILLCGLLIYNSLGYFLVLSVMRVAVRHQKWAQLSSTPDEQLTTFCFSKYNSDQRLKIVNKREIIVDGRLYDIVRKTDNGSTVTYYCLYDHKEETLIAKTRLFNSNAQQMPLQNKARLIVEKIIKSGIIDKNIDLLSVSYILLLTNCIEVDYSCPTIPISIPPPQSCC